MLILEFYNESLEAQIGYILAWWRSEGWKQFNTWIHPDGEAIMINIRKVENELTATGKDFNTAFLSILSAFCKTIK